MSKNLMIPVHRRYHFELGIPDLPEPEVGLVLTWTTHAQAEFAKERGRGWTGMPYTLPEYDLIEVETDETESWRLPVKYLVRTHESRKGYQLVLSIDPHGVVRTCWLNRADDTHTTLNRELYDRPE